MGFGTHSLSDLQASSNQVVYDYGEDRLWDQIRATLEAHNRLFDEKYGQLCETTTDRVRRYGGQALMTMADLDEFGSPDAEKITAGSDVGFPLRRKGRALAWTRDYLEEATVGEITSAMDAIMDADVRYADLALRNAVFNSANATFVDRLLDSVSLPVKAFVNADSAPIPVDINGNTFNAATHTHYLATASLAAADVDAVVNTVVEHYANAGYRAMLYINSASEAAVRAFAAAGQFTAYPLDGVRYGTGVTVAAGRTLDPNNPYNRAIGVWGNASAEVWVKPWIPANYMFAWMMGAPKPLVLRVKNARTGVLRLVADDEQYPLRAKRYTRDYGFGVWNRTNGAVLYTGGGSYVVPTLAA